MSCAKEEKKFKKSELIPAGDMVPVITDLHLADGLLALSEVREHFNNMDSLEHYSLVLKDYGYTLKQFNNTIEYYSDSPKELEKIYKKVLVRLSELESEVKSSDKIEEKSLANLWKGKTSWELPKDGKQNKIGFQVPVNKPGLYKIIADIIIYPDDQSFDPCITAYFWYDNQTESGYRIYFPNKRISKSGNMRTYRITKKILNPKITHLKGFLLDHSEKQGNWEKHITVANFRIEYEPIAGL